MEASNIGADATLANDRFQVHPQYNSDDGDSIPDVWVKSDAVRFLLNKAALDKADRDELASALVRQIKTLPLYNQLVISLDPNVEKKPNINVYVLQFPGTGKDNTGIKDLNDKILGYSLGSEFIVARQKKIGELFNPYFGVIGQDFKTASFLTKKSPRTQFDKLLKQLDAALRAKLLELLPEARKDAKQDKERVKRIDKLARALKNKKYRFDMFYGVGGIGIPPIKEKDISVVAVTLSYLLLTEGMKAAGIGRFIAKGRTLKRKEAKKFAKDVGPDRRMDPRGKMFDLSLFRKSYFRAGGIKDFMSRMSSRDNPRDYIHVYIDTVWTLAFLKRRRQFFGNPDVIRDVRKGKLKKPRVRDGNVKLTYKAQKELLEFWMVILNMIDFIKEFTAAEFPLAVTNYHSAGYDALKELLQPVTEPINRKRLEVILTHDVRFEKVAVLGAASEFLFFTHASDFSEQIFFSMDIRDLGVELALYYEHSNQEVEDHKYHGYQLMEETFRASDPIIAQKRAAHAAVVRIFKKFHGSAKRKLPEFEKCVQILLGGDEIFVAAHPYFIIHESEIISRVSSIPMEKFGNIPMRASVAHSESKIDASKQRKLNQMAHHQALKLADTANGTLKTFERAQRRIERLIAMLEANEQKRHRAADFERRLEKLGLLRLYCRVHRFKNMDSKSYLNALNVLSKEKPGIAAKDSHFDYVNFKGEIVNIANFELKAKRLEADVRDVVGADNTHIDPPPVTKEPKIVDKIFKLIDKIWPAT